MGACILGKIHSTNGCVCGTTTNGISYFQVGKQKHTAYDDDIDNEQRYKHTRVTSRCEEVRRALEGHSDSVFPYSGGNHLESLEQPSMPSCWRSCHTLADVVDTVPYTTSQMFHLGIAIDCSWSLRMTNETEPCRENQPLT